MMANRGSVSSYLWGMRLAKFVKEMESLEYPNLEGFGPIVCNESDNFKGFYSDDDLEENLEQKYRDILEKIRK